MAVTAFTQTDVALASVLDTEALRGELRQMRAVFARIACFLADDVEFNVDALIPEEKLDRRYAVGRGE